MPSDPDSTLPPSIETENARQSRARMEQLINLAFKREVIRKVNDVILPLNDVGCGPAFYCVHAIGGVAADFRHMARMLGPQQNFYGIQAPTDKRNAEFVKSIESISQHYVDELINFQPEGPFLLGGHSVGATIALEMSQQLIARGREVRLLVVFDGGLLNTGAEISPLNPIRWLKLLSYLPRWINELLMAKYSFRSFLRMIANKAISEKLSSRHAVESIVNLSAYTPGHGAFMKGLHDRHLEYVPRSYSGRVMVFAARTDELLNHGQVKAAWKTIAPASEIFEIEGTHVDIMQMPRGFPVAMRLRETINGLSEQIRPFLATASEREDRKTRNADAPDGKQLEDCSGKIAGRVAQPIVLNSPTSPQRLN